MEEVKKYILGACLIPVILFVFLFYGPFEHFRTLWINTAMYTSNYKFLATSLFPEEYITKVINETALTTEEITDRELINIRKRDDIQYTDIEGDNYKGFLMKVNDPNRVSLVTVEHSKGVLLEDITLAHNAVGGINASGYADEQERGGEWGYCIADGNIINECHESEKHTIGGMDAGGTLVVGNFKDDEIQVQDFRWAIEFGPILIVNGEKIEANKYSGGYAPRTAIGQTKDGAMLLLVVNGRQISSVGASFADLQTVLYANGAINAIALDGGSSTTMVYDGEVVNSPSDGDSERLLPNALIIDKK